MSSKPKTATPKGDGKPALVPKLRFPEFRGAEGWKETRLGQLGELVAGLTYSPDDVRETGLLVLRSSNVQNGEIALVDNVYVAPAIRGANLSQPNDILICVRNGSKTLIGKNALIPEGMPLCTHGAFMTMFRAQTPRFAFQLFQTTRYHKQVAGDLGATINSINGSQLLKYKFTVPAHAEQQKIAECLSSVDEVIAAQARKVEGLKTHKKGLMQQLFPREGGTQPRLRFPEFSSAKAWQRQKISNLLSRVSDSVTVEPDRMYREIGIRSHGKGIFHKDFVSGKQIGSKRVFSVVTDAFIVNIIFAWEQAVATTSIAEVGMIASHRFPMYIPLVGRCHVNYMKYFFLTKTGKYLLGLASPGGAGRNRTLGQKEFEKLEIVLPQEVDEQMRIADCLSSIDTLITLEIQKLEALKTHKRGLMQQLFPSSEAVKG